VSDLLRVLVVLGLVGANAFFVIGEYAVVTARRGTLSARAAAGSARARAALRLMDDPVRVISTVQVGITALGILTGALGEPLVRDLLGEGLPAWAGFVLAFAIVTYLSVVLGELVPKALTLDRAERLAMVVARPVELISLALRPLVWVLERSAAVLLRPFGIREVTAGAGISSADELRALVDEAQGAGVIPRAQEELIYNVFDFAGREVRHVMVPAPDVRWLDAGLSPAAALDALLSTPHTRAPVGRGSLDLVVGVVDVRALAGALRLGKPATVGALARPVPVVPETKDLAALLRELREERQPVAVVADEYGSTTGIVTLEDVVEELVGNVEDEVDLPDARMERVDARTVRMAGSVSVDAVNETLGIRLPVRDAHTVAGLVFAALGRRPVVGDRVELDEVALVVDALDGLRITRLTLTLPEAAPAPPGDP
jgi:putative hemolysin